MAQAVHDRAIAFDDSSKDFLDNVELKKVLADTPLWDKRVGILQITDATAGFVRVRILVSASDAGRTFDLRCKIREGLLDFIQREYPDCLPRIRSEAVNAMGNTDGKP